MRHLPAVLRKLWLPALVMVGVIFATFGLFAAVFGWHRLADDFWPFDNSRIGPNLCASITIVVLVTAHNEYRTIRDAESRGESLEQIEHDAAEELLHPTQSAEASIAQDIVDRDA